MELSNYKMVVLNSTHSLKDLQKYLECKESDIVISENKDIVGSILKYKNNFNIFFIGNFLNLTKEEQDECFKIAREENLKLIINTSDSFLYESMIENFNLDLSFII